MMEPQAYFNERQPNKKEQQNELFSFFMQ